MSRKSEREVIIRTKDSHTFISGEVLDSDGDSKLSNVFNCKKYSKFLLYVQIVEIGNPADSTVQIKVKFSDSENGQYHDYMNGPFGFMMWEEDAIPSGTEGLVVCTSGDCDGKYIKVYIEADRPAGATLDASNYFTVTVKADFMG